MKTVSILHTGGTIASKVDYETGAVKAKFTPKDILDMFPEIENIVNIKSRLVKNMLSENMNFRHYNLLAKEIQKEIKKGSDGIIITHGTDTLGYTSAALSFILEDLPVPVIFVGAQRSSDRGSSDASLNLICACHFIENTNFAEVAICMHESMNDDFCLILPGTKTKKFHSSRRDAFKAVNTKPWARVSKDGSILFLKNDYKKLEKRKLKLKLIKDTIKVGIIKTKPNMSASEFRLYKNFDGLIIEGTGLGHAPIIKTDSLTIENQKLYLEIKRLAKKIPVVMTTQTIFGRIDMNVYSTGIKLQEIGVLGNYCDMLTETAYIKLAWLLSNYKKSEVKNLIVKDLRGEISERTPKEFLEEY